MIRSGRDRSPGLRQPGAGGYPWRPDATSLHPRRPPVTPATPADDPRDVGGSCCRCGRRHARLRKQWIFSRRKRPDHAHRPRRAELFSESRAPAAILCPAALRAGTALRDPRRRRPHRRVRYVLPRHKAANWVGPGRGRKSTRPGANGVVELSPFDFLDRLADLVPRPRKHRHRYHGVFAPNHKLRSAVTALAIGNVGKRRDAATGGHAVGGHAAGGDATGDCCDSCDKPRSHDTSRIAWAELMARVGEEFPLECPMWWRHPAHRVHHGTGADPEYPHTSGEPLEPPPVSSARGPPDRLGRARAGPRRPGNLSGVARRTARDRHPQPLTGSHATVRTAREKSGFKAGLRQQEKSGLERG